MGADGTVYSVFDTTIVSASQITFKMGVDGATGGYDKAQRPYTLKVTTNSGLVTQSSATIGFGGLSWTSPGANATLNYTSGTASTENLVATDEIGGSAVTFSIVSGTLNGLTLGSATASPATFGGSAIGTATNSVVFRITDTVSGATADRTFSIEVTAGSTPTGEATFTTTGTSTWVAPTGVNTVHVVCVGGGGGGGEWMGSGGAGGGLAYKNTISVTPGTSYTVIVGAGGVGQMLTNASVAVAAGSSSTGNGGTSSFTVPGGLVVGTTGGEHGCSRQSSNRTVAGQPAGGAPSGTYDGGGTGGTCEGPYATNAANNSKYSSGGGGAGGYSGTGGKGAGSLNTPVYQGAGAALTSATAGSGGGGGGGGSRYVEMYGYNTFSGPGGGGVGLLGVGSDGVAGTDAILIPVTTQAPTTNGGGGGSGGDTGNLPPTGASPLLTNSNYTLTGGAGGLYGGGGGPPWGNYNYCISGAGGNGAVRIIWGTGRSFPSNAV